MSNGSVCFLCKKELDVDFVRVEHNGEDCWVCAKHPRPEKEEKNDR